MAWQIEFDDAAQKEFRKLSRPTQRRIRDYLRERISTADDPRQFGKPLKYGKTGFWCYRVGKYRIICLIEEKRSVVLVLRIGKRNKVYKTDL